MTARDDFASVLSKVVPVASGAGTGYCGFVQSSSSCVLNPFFLSIALGADSNRLHHFHSRYACRLAA